MQNRQLAGSFNESLGSSPPLDAKLPPPRPPPEAAPRPRGAPLDDMAQDTSA